MMTFLRLTLLVFLLIKDFASQAQVRDSTLVVKEVDSLIQVSRGLTQKQQFIQALEVNATAEKIALDRFGRKSAPFGSCCFNRGRIYYLKGTYSEAEVWYLEAKDIREKVLGKDHLDYARSLNNLAGLYKDIGDYTRSEALYLESNAIRKKVLGKEHPDYALGLNNLGNLYRTIGNYASAEPLYLESKAIREKILGKNHPDYAASLGSLANLYISMGNYEKAEPLYMETLDIQEKTLGREHPNYALTLTNLTLLYQRMGEYIKAEQICIEAISTNEKTLGKEHPEYARSVHTLAVLYHSMGNYAKAEPLYIETTAIWEKVLGKNNLNYTSSIIDLATLYYNISDYRKAEQLYLEAEAIQEKVLGKDQPGHATILIGLANLYDEMGKYAVAEPLYLKSKTILEKTVGKNHPDYARSLYNLAILYHFIGNYAKAESLYLESIAIRENALGKEHPDYANSLHNLATLYDEMGHYKKSESLQLESMAIREKVLGKDHPEYALSLSSLAILYQNMGHYNKSEPLYLESMAIREKILGKDHPDYASSLYGLAKMYQVMGNYSKSELLCLEAKAIWEKAFGIDHPNYAESLKTIAKLYQNTNNFEKSESIYINLDAINKSMIENAVKYMPVQELEKYFNRVPDVQNELLSFARMAQSKSLIPVCYNNILYYKGFLLDAINNTQHLALSDSIAAPKYFYLKDCGRRLASQYTLPIAERDRVMVAELEAKANDLEKDLVRTVIGYGQAKRQVNYNEVQAILKTGEAAIEFVHYQYNYKNATDSTMYAALVLAPNAQDPYYIPLFEEKQLQSLLEKTGDNAEATTNLYAARTGDLLGQAPVYGKELYNLIWRPLDSLLRGVKTVYFSPSGLLHRVAFAALPVDAKKVLSDKYELHQLGSTRSLVVKTPEPVAQRYTAAVFGGVQYDRNPTLTDSIAPEITDNRLWAYIDRPRTAGDEGFDYLPGTAQEAVDLTRALQAQRVQVQTNTGAQASEETLKSLGRDTVKSPDILHIATHGFFFPDPEKRKEQRMGGENAFKWNENPLFRSGLVLAGANTAWSGQPTPGNIEDGIATAYEISHLNLSNTKLVVLSACESGLGDIKGSEGVYGLQRAFKMAGADYLLVSLWQVPDKETVEFMNAFYKSWLSGKTIHEAFAKAQKKMRKKHKEVYKWGAWVLVE